MGGKGASGWGRPSGVCCLWAPGGASWLAQLPPCSMHALHMQPASWQAARRMALQDFLTLWQVSSMRPIPMSHMVQVPFRFSQARQFFRGHCRAAQRRERGARWRGG